MSAPLKALVVVAGVGTVSTGAYFTIFHIRGSSIRERLEKAGYSILNLDKEDKTHSAEWEKIKEAYGKEVGESLRFSGVKHKDESTIEEIKNACSSLLSSKSETSEDLEKARRGCVVPVTVASRIGDNLALLNTTTTTTTNSDDSLWSEKLTEHKKDSPKFSKIPDVGGEQDNDDPKKTTALKKKCEEMAKLHTFDKDFETFVSYTRDWCTKPKQG